MAKEPILTFRLSKPDRFQCSLCRGGDGMFSPSTSMRRLLDDFREHVEKYHAVEDVNQAAARIVREATEG